MLTFRLVSGASMQKTRRARFRVRLDVRACSLCTARRKGQDGLQVRAEGGTTRGAVDFQDREGGWTDA